MIKRLYLTAIFLSLTAGCAHEPTVQEVHQKQEAAADRGRAKFSDELVAGNVAWYVTNSGALTGFNRQTGLPEQLIGATTDEPMIDDFVKAHNDAILNYITQSGPIPGSFKGYVNQLDHQAIYFDTHQSDGVQTLKLGGESLHSPDGAYALSLRASGATLAQITTAGSQLVITGPGGEHQSPAPSGTAGGTADVLFAPAGSNLAFTRWPGSGQPIYAALDLRNGRWLVVQNGR
jgi:hypothetical protein